MRRSADSLRQATEYLLAAVLVTSALHAPEGAALLLGAALALAGWAGVHNAPLAAARLVGAGAHRAGLVVLAIAVGAVVVLSGRLGDLAVSVPALFAAAALLQLAIRRRPRSPMPSPDPTPPPSAPDPLALARLTGIATGRAGILVSKQVDRVVPAGARQAGRLVGRLKHRRPPK